MVDSCFIRVSPVLSTVNRLMLITAKSLAVDRNLSRKSITEEMFEGQF